MQLSSTLSWLVDAAGEVPGADRLLAELGARLVADGLPLAGGALTLAVPHPLIARRTWLWRAESGEVIEALGFVAGGLAAAGAASPPGDAGRPRLADSPLPRAHALPAQTPAPRSLLRYRPATARCDGQSADAAPPLTALHPQAAGHLRPGARRVRPAAGPRPASRRRYRRARPASQKAA